MRFRGYLFSMNMTVANVMSNNPLILEALQVKLETCLLLLMYYRGN